MRKISAFQLSVTFIPSVCILFAIAAVSVIYHVRIPTMTRDVAAIADIHPLTGILSNLGVLLWCATSTVCLFSSLVLRRVQSKEILSFLVSSGLLSLYLLVDDFFEIHEDLASRYLGLDEKVVIAALGVVVFAYLIMYGRVILRTNHIFFLIALGFLGCSVFIDTIFEEWMTRRFGQWEFFFEDGTKWLGIASWCSYYVHTSYQFLVGGFGQSAPPSSRARLSARPPRKRE